MSIALAGAHRVGKSTLAKAFAEKHDYTFLPSRAGQAHAELGLPVGSGLSSDQRMAVQERILDYHVEDIRKLTGQHWISDRSAFDFATYTLLDAAHDASYDHDRVAAYVDRCFLVAKRHYGCIVIVQPGIPYVAEEGKPPPNASQQEAFNAILWGLTQDARCDCRTGYLRRPTLALEERVDCVMFLANHMQQVDLRVAQQVALH